MKNTLLDRMDSEGFASPTRKAKASDYTPEKIKEWNDRLQGKGASKEKSEEEKLQKSDMDEIEATIAEGGSLFL